MVEKILLIGPMTNTSNSKLTGGAIVAFENLLESLQKQKVDYLLVDTNKKNYSNILFAYLSIIAQILSKQFQVKHITLHSSRDYLYLAPLIIVLGKTFRKSTSLRKFGGEAWDTYIGSSGIKKKLLTFIFKNIDFLFLEMNILVNNFKKLNINTFWFPNVRKNHSFLLEAKKYRKRFVFMSHVKREKGIDELITVVRLLDNSYILDIYGTIDQTQYSEASLLKQGVRYKGALNAKEVLSTLSEYDVLVLPSYKEGYPGIVIEAYSMGLPIIVTALSGLKEITDDYETGILIEKQNVQQLKEAIEYFNENNYDKMSINAREKFSLFNSEKQTELFLNTIKMGL